MSKEILQNIIEDFDPEKFIRFFREKNRSFSPRQEKLTQYNDENFVNGLKLGEIQFTDGKLMACVFKAGQPLSERSGKKTQYEVGKKILRDLQADAGIFIFYDKDGNFRFSLIYPEAIGNHRQWSNFRRFTYFVSREFTNKTFLQRIGDGYFSTLEKIKDAFSVEKVTKEFYKDIANWYFWAIQNVQFPKDAEAEENGRNIAVIRLITRLIFIWFMRERGLVPKNLFDKTALSGILKDLTSEKPTYYQGILQNLFFATLSTKKSERKFRSEQRFYKGYNPDFGDHSVYRFHKLFKDSAKMPEYFGEIPFLNGGLFECLDDKKNGIIIDGFSDTKKNQPEVPNYLFFSNEQKVDLNTAYGTKNKIYKVRGLLDILLSYNFTIDENELDDQEVALDPELLGRVFENLLASFNPETSTTARKATGSYYTPREIVDYMVTESLKRYFKTHLADVPNLEEKLEKLFSRDNQESSFEKEESEKIASLIESLRIVDPAVGSGAFLMGALNKLVFILSKIDPQNLFWKKAQINAVKQNVTDPVVKQKLIDQIEKQFQEKNIDYGRKLFLIQKCIYGVDIQQIAVEIARLRFFISLLVDERIDKDKENWGIESLPNLDFKLMQGNSLISEFLGVNFDEEKIKDRGGFNFEDKTAPLIKEFEQKKSEFQSEPDRNRKEVLKQEVDNLIIKIFETKLKKQRSDYFNRLQEIERKYSVLPNEKQRNDLMAKEKEELYKRTGFNLETIERQLREYTSGLKTKPFFFWKLYFAEVFQEPGGFDVVIANPPYISFGLRGAVKNNTDFLNLVRKNYPNSAEYKLSIYALFIDRGIQLLRKHGMLCYITPDSFLLGRYFSKLRRYIIDTCRISEILMLETDFWESGVVGRPIITLFQKEADTNSRKTNSPIYKLFQSLEDFNQGMSKVFSYEQNYFAKIPHNRFRLFFERKEKELVDKIEKDSKPLLEFITFASGLIGKKGKEEIIADEIKASDWYPGLLSGREIKKYFIGYKGNFILFDKQKLKSGFKEARYFEPKIFLRQTGDNLIAAYDDANLLCLNNLHVGNCKAQNTDINYLKFILSFLNSKLLNYYYKLISLESNRVMAQTDIETIELLPIKKPTPDVQVKIVSIVNKILIMTKSDDYLADPTKQAKAHGYENQIDQMVYKLYGLTPEEIVIVEENLK